MERRGAQEQGEPGSKRSNQEEEFVAEESRSQQSPAASRNDPLVPSVALYRTIPERVKEKRKERERERAQPATAIATGPFETNLGPPKLHSLPAPQNERHS